MKKVMIVEDDSLLENLESEKFTHEGFQVMPASSGREVQTLLASGVPDIVLLDLVLPEMDGFEILTMLKKDEKTKNVPVIIFSNLSNESDIERAKSLGAADFIVKANFTLDEIVQKIKSVLNMSGEAAPAA